jgi:hypothetical protein
LSVAICLPAGIAESIWVCERLFTSIEIHTLQICAAICPFGFATCADAPGQRVRVSTTMQPASMDPRFNISTCLSNLERTLTNAPKLNRGAAILPNLGSSLVCE